MLLRGQPKPEFQRLLNRRLTGQGGSGSRVGSGRGNHTVVVVAVVVIRKGGGVWGMLHMVGVWGGAVAAPVVVVVPSAHASASDC